MMGKLTEFLAKIGLIRARGIHYIGGSLGKGEGYQALTGGAL